MARLHALVIGVSHYPHSTDPVLASIAGPAISAARFADWLRTSWNHPGVALGSLEVLLSPMEDDEAATADAAAGKVAGPADAKHVGLEVYEWAERCNVSTEDIALLYVAGHGTESLYGGGFLLLEDYDAPGSGALGNALDLDHVRKAIGTKCAHADFIFVDACRFTTDEQFDVADASALKPIKWNREDATLRTHLKVFYGAAPDQEFLHPARVDRARARDDVLQGAYGGPRRRRRRP
ncbi:MAG: caspase family protein [Thermoleophilaceae bacterium]